MLSISLQAASNGASLALGLQVGGVRCATEGKAVLHVYCTRLVQQCLEHLRETLSARLRVIRTVACTFQHKKHVRPPLRNIRKAA